MKKRLIALFAAVLLVFGAALPAYAEVHGNSNRGGSMNTIEDELLSKFDGIMKKYEWFTHRDQYYEEARAALLDSRIDLDSTAKTKFNTVLDNIDSILATCNSQAEAWEKYPQIGKLVNDVSKSYKMTVTVDSVVHDATVTISDSSSGSSSTAATTASTVKQTGFDFSKSAAVAAGSVAVLAGAYFVARKYKLFS